MLGAKQESVCKVCWSDKSIQHSEQRKNVARHGMAWLSSKVLKHDHPAAWRPVGPSQMQQLPLRALPDHQWCKARLCPGTDSLHSLLQHDAQISLLMIGIESISDTVLMASCSISDYRLTWRPWSNWSETSAMLTMLPLLPTQSLAVHIAMLKKCYNDSHIV